MNATNSKLKMHKYEFSAPGYYRIEVQGRLSQDWLDRLGAMQVEAHSPREDINVTVLQGRVSDQAQLSGILNTLYELHLPLLAVKYLGDETSRD
jgi:hypothetical protein